MLLSKSKIKYIRSLSDKKHRQQHGTFVAEGKKLVFDLLQTCQCKLLAALPEVLAEIPTCESEEIIESSLDELKKASQLKTAPQIIGVFHQPQYDSEKLDLESNIHLALDGIQDPGNMGTIVRIADWFGIEHIFCSPDTVDIYNPKTVQATMGAIARVKVHYVELTDFLKKNNHLPVYGTFLRGENIYEEKLSKNGFIAMGNEGKGISPDVSQYITNRIFIPNFPHCAPTSESLNVAVAAAVVCSEFRRRK